eukprot:2108346-Ditylum_brightwellii.AAC.1
MDGVGQGVVLFSSDRICGRFWCILRICKTHQHIRVGANCFRGDDVHAFGDGHMVEVQPTCNNSLMEQLELCAK